MIDQELRSTKLTLQASTVDTIAGKTAIASTRVTLEHHLKQLHV